MTSLKFEMRVCLRRRHPHDHHHRRRPRCHYIFMIILLCITHTKTIIPLIIITIIIRISSLPTCVKYILPYPVVVVLGKLKYSMGQKPESVKSRRTMAWPRHVRLLRTHKYISLLSIRPNIPKQLAHFAYTLPFPPKLYELLSLSLWVGFARAEVVSCVQPKSSSSCLRIKVSLLSGWEEMAAEWQKGSNET